MVCISNGSSGENFLINKEQKKRVFEIVKDEAGDEIKLIAQVGALDLNESIELGKFATSLGYDAIISSYTILLPI